MDENLIPIVLECESCGTSVAAAVIGSYTFLDSDREVIVRCSLTKCPRCNRPMVAASENDGDWNDDSHFGAPYRLFPPLTRLGPAVPKAISQAYLEAARCMTAGAHTAVAIMCRKALEAMVVDHEIRRRSLAEALREMREQDLIDGRLFEWADSLRLTGNEAAHNVAEVVSPSDARDILDFTRALMEYIYTFRDQFDSFKRRRDGQPRSATS